MPALVFIYILIMESTIDITEKKKQFFQRIKDETSDLHRRTEGSRLSVALMSETLDEKTYGNYLFRMKEIVKYYEENIYPQLKNVVNDIEERRKLHLINDDLSVLQTDLSPRLFTLPPASSTAALLGYMYVLEGSSLGSAMIYKQVSRIINITESRGSAFFTSYGASLSSKWKSFLEMLSEHALEETNAREIIRGARVAFQAIGDHLEQY
jgi:Heme oxygenase